ncbi:hypothetical protein ACFWB1_36300, partial [Streptomyces goshikiensis]|uniref:hypothetical protein n=1 Tax=Streptomyces goshikiensis TaxID=1942 RepID=UPI0036887DBC
MAGTSASTLGLVAQPAHHVVDQLPPQRLYVDGWRPGRCPGGLPDATALRAVAASWLADAPREGLAEAR